MKYLLIILLFVSSFCYGQEPISNIGKIVYDSTTISTIKKIRDSINLTKYDTTLGFVQIIDSKGLLVRGMGVKIDSVEYIPLGELVWLKESDKNICSYNHELRQLRTTIKIYFDACDCLLDVKKWFNFIPVSMAQPITIYDDEKISISPNENYKK